VAGPPQRCLCRRAELADRPALLLFVQLGGDARDGVDAFSHGAVADAFAGDQFPGFTHICAKTKTGGFTLQRITDSKRLQAKRRSVKAELMRRRHQPIPEQGRWLASVLRGHTNYYGVPGNRKALLAFRFFATEHWYRALRRRTRLTWQRMRRLRERWLPLPQIAHPWPEGRFDARTQGRSPVS
jgi:hypothetical protein